MTHIQQIHIPPTTIPKVMLYEQNQFGVKIIIEATLTKHQEIAVIFRQRYEDSGWHQWQMIAIKKEFEGLFRKAFAKIFALTEPINAWTQHEELLSLLPYAFGSRGGFSDFYNFLEENHIWNRYEGEVGKFNQDD